MGDTNVLWRPLWEVHYIGGEHIYAKASPPQARYEIGCACP